MSSRDSFFLLLPFIFVSHFLFLFCLSLSLSLSLSLYLSISLYLSLSISISIYLYLYLSLSLSLSLSIYLSLYLSIYLYLSLSLSISLSLSRLFRYQRRGGIDVRKRLQVRSRVLHELWHVHCVPEKHIQIDDIGHRPMLAVYDGYWHERCDRSDFCRYVHDVPTWIPKDCWKLHQLPRGHVQGCRWRWCVNGCNGNSGDSVLVTR